MTEDFRDQIAKLLKHRDVLPRHIAVIMDGSGRWAKSRGLPRLAGHRKGRASVRTTIQTCLDLGIGHLTLYTFSTENWNRPRAEVEGLMKFLHHTLKEERADLERNGVSMGVVGDVDALPPAVRKVVDATIEQLKNGKRLRLTLALSYGGRQELVHAARSLARDVESGLLPLEEVNEESFAARLWTAGLPDPDLLIRTSGEMRVSNFLLWQIAYSELWVTPTMWPDFRETHLCDAIEAYLQRDRRFGKVRPKAKPAARR
jgi:undecaprenyl diphosphate synthase